MEILAELGLLRDSGSGLGVRPVAQPWAAGCRAQALQAVPRPSTLPAAQPPVLAAPLGRGCEGDSVVLASC